MIYLDELKDLVQEYELKIAKVLDRMKEEIELIAKQGDREIDDWRKENIELERKVKELEKKKK